jgi:hypothetical protein
MSYQYQNQYNPNQNPNMYNSTNPYQSGRNTYTNQPGSNSYNFNNNYNSNYQNQPNSPTNVNQAQNAINMMGAARTNRLDPNRNY